MKITFLQIVETVGMRVLVWAVIGLVMMAAELVVPGAVLVFLGLSAVIVSGLLYFGFIQSILASLTAFFIISIFMIIVLRGFALRLFPGEITVHETDEDKEAIGSIVEVIEDIRPSQFGRVRFQDTTWEAQSDELLSVGESAVIIGRNGNIWIVKILD